MNSLKPASEQESPARYFNTRQAAAYLNLSHQYLEIARHKGGGPQYIKLAKAVRYRLEDLDEWMDSHTQKHTADTNIGGTPHTRIDQLDYNDGLPLDNVIEQDDPPNKSVKRIKRGGQNG